MGPCQLMVLGVALVLPCVCATYQNCLHDSLRRGTKSVKVTDGYLQGVKCPHIHNFTRVEAYKGIKYASLRRGRMRFMPPSSNERKWQGIRFQGSLSIPCSQRALNWTKISQQHHHSKWWKQRLYRKMHDFKISMEDCLHLNLFIP
ncbi:neuroligin-4, Y-linked-like, partial [Mizuhopecten yessoensis]